MNGPSSRMLQLLSLLQTGRAWPARDLAERVGTTPRTLRRDLDRLREFGYPVESTRGPGGSYRLVAGRAMPPLVLTDEEAIATAVGLRMAARASAAADGALRKLERVLPPRLRRRVAAVAAVSAPSPGARHIPDFAVIDVLATAAHTRREVRFTYTDRAGVVSARRVEPYRQVLLERHWYVQAWDLDRDGWRTFRVDRVSSVAETGAVFTPRESLPDPVVRPSADGPAGVVHFAAPVSSVSARLHAQAGVLEGTGRDLCRYTCPPDDWAWLAAVVAMVGVPYRVEGPAALVAETERLATRAAHAVRGQSGGCHSWKGVPWSSTQSATSP